MDNKKLKEIDEKWKAAVRAGEILRIMLEGGTLGYQVTDNQPEERGRVNK